jgi:hypothetical protein
MHFFLGKQPSAELMFSFLSGELARKRKFGNIKLNTSGDSTEEISKEKS